MREDRHTHAHTSNIQVDWYTGIAGITAALAETGMIRMREDRHTHAHTSNIQVDWYTGIVTDFVYRIVTNFLCLYLCHTLILFIKSSLNCFVYKSYQSIFVYRRGITYTRSHQCPRGGERLAGRYTAKERLHRRLRLSRLEVRGRLVGASSVGG